MFFMKKGDGVVRLPIIYDKLVSSKGQELLEQMFGEKIMKKEASKEDSRAGISARMSTVGVSRKVYRKPKKRRMF